MTTYADILRGEVAKLDEEREALIAETNALADIVQAEARSNTPEEDSRIDEIVARAEALKSERAAKLERIAALDALAEERAAVPPSPSFIPSRPDTTVADVRSLSRAEARDTARRIADTADWVRPETRAALDRTIAKRTDNCDGDLIARRLIATERPEYRDAFMKGVTGRGDTLTDAERRAVDEVRIMSLTTTAGGFGVPVLIDPTVLITDGTGLAGLLPYCRVEPITTKEWKGVSAGHTAWSFDAELAEVSDDTSTFAQPTVTTFMARALVPYSIEIGMDYPGFASEIGGLLAEGYMDTVAETIAIGDGTNEPWGIFATTTTTVDVTTDNTFGAPDIDKVWAALGETFRSRATWFMNVDVENDIRGFGSGTATSRFTVDQTREGISLLNGRPVVLSDWAPTWTGTDAASILVLGDFSKFLIAQRVGMTVEYIPHLTSTGNNLPNGKRGLFAYARWGSDKTVQNAFRKLKNITT